MLRLCAYACLLGRPLQEDRGYRKRRVRLSKATWVNVTATRYKVSRSGYYGWKDRLPLRRVQENAVLTEKTREIHKRSRETYGSPRVHAELKSIGVRCGRKRVARLMRKEGTGCIRGRRKRTTRRNKHASLAEDLVHRDFIVAAPDRLWTADITYVDTPRGVFCTWLSC